MSKAVKAAPVPTSDNANRHDMLVKLAGVEVFSTDHTGTTLAVPTIELSAQDAEVIDRVFANTQHLIGHALAIEALLTRIVS